MSCGSRLQAIQRGFTGGVTVRPLGRQISRGSRPGYSLMMLGWDAAWLQAYAYMALAAGAVFAGGWSLYNYRKTRRSDAARWLTGVFRDF